MSLRNSWLDWPETLRVVSNLVALLVGEHHQFVPVLAAGWNLAAVSPPPESLSRDTSRTSHRRSGEVGRTLNGELRIAGRVYRCVTLHGVPRRRPPSCHGTRAQVNAG